MPNWVKVAKASEIPPGGRTIAEVDGVFIAVFNVDNQFYSIEDVCTHDGGPVAEGDLDGYEVECPRHGARFDIRTGKVLSLPAVAPVTAYEVKVEGDDLYVDVN